MTDLGTIAGFADKVGVVALLIFILFSGMKRWWVFGWTYKEERERSQEWRDLALTGTRIAEHIAENAKTTTSTTTRRREAGK